MIDERPRLGIVYTTGDQLPELVGVLKDTNLTDCTITLTLARPSTVLSKEATIVDAAAGKFSIEWEDTDLVAGLGQEAVIRIEDADGLVTTLLRFMMDVEALPEP